MRERKVTLGLIFSSIGLSFLLSYCGGREGDLSFAFHFSSSPPQDSSLLVRIELSGPVTRRVEAPFSQGKVEVSSLPPGGYTIRVELLNSFQEILYRGESYGEVVEGKTTTVRIELTPAG